MVTSEGHQQHAGQRQPGQDHLLTGDARTVCNIHMAMKRADHEDVEVGEVDQLQNAVDQGEPEREQRVHRAQAQSVDGLLQQQVGRTSSAIRPAAPRRCSGIADMSSGAACSCPA